MPTMLPTYYHGYLANASDFFKKTLTIYDHYAIFTWRGAERALFLTRNDQQYLMEDTDMRTKITLACTECKQRNYNTTKEKKNHPDRMEIKKYCRFCKAHTLHKETK